MKLTLALLSLCCSQIALAQVIINTGANCTYILADDYNREVARFEDSTCSDAQYDCEREKSYSISTGSIRNGQCYQLGGGYNQYPGNNNGGYNPYPGNNNGGGYNGGGYNGGGYNPYPGNGSMCEVSLQDSYGVTLQTFAGYDCGQAINTCNSARLSRQTPYQALFCNITAQNGNGGTYGGYNPYPGNGGGYNNRFTCTYDVKDVRSQRAVNSFMQTANTEQQACEVAYNQCMTDARSRNQYSSVQNFVCAKRNVSQGNQYPGNGGGYGQPQQQYATQSCTFKIVAMGGNILEQVSANGSGYGVQQAKQNACQQASILCQNVKAQRTIPGRPSPYASAACQQAY